MEATCQQLHIALTMLQCFSREISGSIDLYLTNKGNPLGRVLCFLRLCLGILFFNPSRTNGICELHVNAASNVLRHF